VVWLRVLSRTNLADAARHSSLNSRLFILLQTLLRSEEKQPLYNQANPNSFHKTPGVRVPLCVGCRTEAQKCLSVSPLLATLTHFVSRKSFPCHSYANTRDRGATLAPNLSSNLLSDFSRHSFTKSVLCEGPHSTRHSLLTLTPFRINTCKSVSKQRTLTSFRINTYEKQGGGG